jgi:hypothetical protein
MRSLSPPAAKLRHLHLGIGRPFKTSPSIRAALEDDLTESAGEYVEYPDERGALARIPGGAHAVFEAVDPENVHDVPKGLAVMPTEGARFAFRVFLDMLEVAIKDFNQLAKPKTLLSGTLILPIPTFGEFADILDARRFLYVKPELLERNDFRFPGADLRKTMQDILNQPGALPMGLVDISTHSPSGRENTYEDVKEKYRAAQSLNRKRREKLAELVGGETCLAQLCKENRELAKIVRFLSEMKIFEDGVYFGTETGALRSFSYQALYKLFPGVNDNVVTGFSASKTAGAPRMLAGVAICGQKLMSKYQEALQASIVGANGSVWAIIHTIFDPKSKHSMQQRGHHKTWKKRLAANRGLVDHIGEGAKPNGIKAVTDPYTGKPWEGKIQGVRVVKGGQSGMFRVLEFDKEHWWPYLRHYAKGVKKFDAAMKLFLKGLEVTLTPPDKTLDHETHFRIKCDALPEDVLEGLARLHHVETLAPVPSNHLKQQKTPLKALER